MENDSLTIRNCTFAFRCKANWDEMTRTDREGKVRFCLDCQKQVYLCETDEELVDHVTKNHCVVIERVEEDENRRLLGDVVG